MRVSHLSLYLESKKYPFNPLEENGQTEWSQSSVQAIKTVCSRGCTDWTKHVSLIKTPRVQESNQMAVEGTESNNCHRYAEKALFRLETKIMAAYVCACVPTLTGICVCASSHASTHIHCLYWRNYSHLYKDVMLNGIITLTIST